MGTEVSRALSLVTQTSFICQRSSIGQVSNFKLDDMPNVPTNVNEINSIDLLSIKVIIALPVYS